MGMKEIKREIKSWFGLAGVGITLVLLFLVGLWEAGEAEAHMFESSGGIGVVLHVSPDDDPIAGETSQVRLAFSDTSDLFDLKDCECVVVISAAGEEIFRYQIMTGNSDSIIREVSFEVVFPEKNVYSIQISGKPQGGAGFEAFELGYDLRVSRENEKGGMSEEVAVSQRMIDWLLENGLLIVLIMFGIWGVSVYFRKNEIIKK